MVFTFPPRGAVPSPQPDGMPSQSWGHPHQLGPAWTWKPGHLLLGKHDARPIGLADDRHAVLIAGSRAGKTRSVLIPNLRTYPGSCVVIDPKGELARETAAARCKFGPVHVLDPFGVSGVPSASHNPLQELLAGHEADRAADAALLADALIIAPEGARDTHWTDSAKNLVRGLVLHMIDRDGGGSLRTLRRLLNMDMATQSEAFEAMAGSASFGGALANIGQSYMDKLRAAGDGSAELASILSTAREQTTALDDIAHIADRSDFALGDLKASPATVYLVLPAMRIGTHFRWLRLVVQLAAQAMERTPTDRTALPVWFVLEEFPVLGHMRTLETAAGFMAGFGIKLVAVIQDLQQLKRHYPKSWETFLGNAGVVMAFGNADQTTTEYLSSRLGTCRVAEWRPGDSTTAGMAGGRGGAVEVMHSAPLLAPFEIAQAFSRRTGRAMILTPERPPLYLQRLEGPDDIPQST